MNNDQGKTKAVRQLVILLTVITVIGIICLINPPAVNAAALITALFTAWIATGACLVYAVEE